VSTDPAAPQLPTASWGRRALALMVDWVACTLVVSLFTPVYGVENQTGQWWVLGLFVVESALLTATAGGSFGKLATRLRVVRVDGGAGPLPPLRALARSVLVALVIPPLVYRPDRRGLHDLAAGSATVPLQAAATGTPTGPARPR
jgi:uncharacterized RDD family membrane protein YckC